MYGETDKHFAYVLDLTFRTLEMRYRATASASSAKYRRGQIEKLENLLVEYVEIGLEDLKQTTIPAKPVSLERGEEVQDAPSAGSAALPLLRVERQVIDLISGHGFADFPLQKRLDQQCRETKSLSVATS